MCFKIKLVEFVSDRKNKYFRNPVKCHFGGIALIKLKRSAPSYSGLKEVSRILTLSGYPKQFFYFIMQCFYIKS